MTCCCTFQGNVLSCVLCKRAGLAGDELLVGRDADEQRGAVRRRHDRVGMLRVEHGNAPGTLTTPRSETKQTNKQSKEATALSCRWACSTASTRPRCLRTTRYPTSCAITSVSVSLTHTNPSFFSSAFSSSEFSITPLCTTAMRPVVSTCGCALLSVFAPCVAHRVCPIPT
jgi:hypothetical protein